MERASKIHQGESHRMEQNEGETRVKEVRDTLMKPQEMKNLRKIQLKFKVVYYILDKENI